MATEIDDPGIGVQFDRKTQPIINKDGTYNIIKIGSKKGFRDIFKYMLEISWFRFFTILFAGYLGMNLVFTIMYFFCGYEHISGIDPNGPHPFMDTFFFSVQTFTTVGYGAMSPTGFVAECIATVEAFTGFLSFSLATGLAYGRFSRPNAKVLFSDNVLYSSYKDGKSLKLKLVNARDNVLLDVSAKVILTMDRVLPDGEVMKHYYRLPLEIAHVELLPYTWTLVHEIDKDSPFWNMSKDEICQNNPEFLVIIKGFDETFSQHVHAKHSYGSSDILWNKQFATIFGPNEDGVIQFDVNDLNKIKDDE